MKNKKVTTETTNTIENIATVGELKRKPGRPADPIKKAEREAKLAARKEHGQGRPVDPNSERQVKLAQRYEQELLGKVIQRGRPAMNEVEKAKAKEIAKEKAAAREAAMKEQIKQKLILEGKLVA
jgi:hypothetical protein